MTRNYFSILVVFLFVAGCSGTAPELGIDNGNLVKCPTTPNCVNSQLVNGEHMIAPIIFTGTLAKAHSQVLNVLEVSSGCELISIEQNYIRAEFTSTFFRFIDA